MNATFRKTLCACGNDSYYATWDFDQPGDGAPVWKCANCSRLTPRRTVRRRTNARRALELYAAIHREWEPVNLALRALVDAGLPSGCLIAYGSAFNYHLRTLSGDHGKITRIGLKVSEQLAREGLASARAFVEEKQKEVLHG